MHYSAKRGLAIACRPSDRPSVTMVDQEHIRWTISPIRHPPNPSGTWGDFKETRGGVGKSGVLEHKSGNISETRKDRGKVTMGAYRNLNALSNGTIPDPLRPPIPHNRGFATPT